MAAGGLTQNEVRKFHLNCEPRQWFSMRSPPRVGKLSMRAATIVPLRRGCRDSMEAPRTRKWNSGERIWEGVSSRRVPAAIVDLAPADADYAGDTHFNSLPRPPPPLPSGPTSRSPMTFSRNARLRLACFTVPRLVLGSPRNPWRGRQQRRRPIAL